MRMQQIATLFPFPPRFRGADTAWVLRDAAAAAARSKCRECSTTKGLICIQTGPHRGKAVCELCVLDVGY